MARDLTDRQGPSTPEGPFFVRGDHRTADGSRQAARRGVRGESSPRRTGHMGRPEARGAAGAAMPGGQARMSGTWPRRRSKRSSHSCLTACPAPRQPATRRGGWWDAPSARAASLASSAALPRPPASPAQPARWWPATLRQWVRQPVRHSLRAGGAYPCRRWSGSSVQLRAPSGGQSAAKTAADWPPEGEWCGRAEWCASRD
jgi:hypothetical protein